jgi:2,3-bisphosphoglycerate-dependent phosphoglycerate mutase
MTELLLIRHGLPVSGVADPGLSEQGRRQAALAAAQLAREGVDALYTSPFRRARETAAPIERLLGLTATVVPDLREWDRELPGADIYTVPEDLPASDPQGRALAEGRYEDFVPALDLVTFQARATAVMTGLLDAHPAGRIAAVTHGGLSNAYLALVAGSSKVFWFNPGYASISRVARMPSGNVVIRSINETAHLHDLTVKVPG